MSKKIIKKTNKTHNLELDVKEKELEYEAIKEAIEKGNIEILSNFKINNLKSTKISTKIPKKLSEKEKEKRDEIRRLKEAEDLAQIQQKLFRQVKGRKKIEPLYKKPLYPNMDVFGSNIEKECEKIFPKEEKNKKIELLKSENVHIKNNNLGNNTERSNMIEGKNTGISKKFKINCENSNEIDEEKDNKYLNELDKEIKMFYIQKCGKIFNFLKDIHLCRYIDDFLKEGYDIYEEFIEFPDDFFEQKKSPFLNKSQQIKFYNKLHNIQSKYKPKYNKNSIINQNKNSFSHVNYNLDYSHQNKLNINIKNDININNENNNIDDNNKNKNNLFSNISEGIRDNNTINQNIIKDTSSKITKEDLMYKTSRDIDELEKQRSEEFKKAVENWRSNNTSRPNTSYIPKNNKLSSEIATKYLYCWNCYKKFLNDGVSKEYKNNYELNTKYNMKNFCSNKCIKEYEKKQRNQCMCFQCKKMFDLREVLIAYEGKKFCTTECKNKYIQEENDIIKNKKNKKENEPKTLPKENKQKTEDKEKNPDNEDDEDDSYDPMNDF